jgi:very-short-patch-repair endonuclease
MWGVVQVERAIIRLAEAQNGVVDRWQLLAFGLGRGAIAHRLSVGRLHLLLRGVYLVGHPMPLPLGVEAGALLACGQGAVLSHHSAAALWGLRPATPPTVEVTVVGRDPGQRPGIRAHRVRCLAAADRTRRHGLPITTPARTILDQAAVVAPRDLERTIDEARAQRLVTDASLIAVVQRASNHRGARAVRAALENQDEPHMTRSEAEEHMLALVRAADLPPFETNRRLLGHTVDFLWRAQRVVVEVDSWQFHRDRKRFEADRRRDADLQAAGHRVLRITARQLRREPLFAAARLGALLGRQAYDEGRPEASPPGLGSSPSASIGRPSSS